MLKCHKNSDFDYIYIYTSDQVQVYNHDLSSIGRGYNFMENVTVMSFDLNTRKDKYIN